MINALSVGKNKLQIENPLQGLFADKQLLILTAILVSIGIIMVASASISFANENYGDPWYFSRRHIIFTGLGAFACLVVALIPLKLWRDFGWLMLIVGIALLVLVLLIGVEINHGRRWLRLGSINIQASELAKFCCLIFFASYFSKWQESIKANWAAIFKPLAVLAVISALILAEPDLGTTAVLVMAIMAMMFIAGIRLWQCFLMSFIALGAFALLVWQTPWRLERIKTFLDPWADQFSSGYQLSQSLIGFGRGEWFGLGLGNSIQKLFFLPEAHTDFIFSIIAEEFGFVGAILVILVFAALVAKAFMLAKEAINQDADFACFIAYGVGVMIACQAFINIGVAAGFLPTKGLTLPFISYGGSSLVASMMQIGLLLRVQKELKQPPKTLAEVQA
ncbi:putative lipid II flippase FtsW [Sessilibacter sp. MAH2]